MEKNPPVKLWRVSIVNRNGYEAPAQFVEAKTRKEAAKLAKNTSRLLEFDKIWSFRLTALYALKTHKSERQAEMFKED